ncbi:unnamed protein product [Nippostrongylus brasiliensis]|uniref:Activin_recp domain-containing protein n=1 Tax=Nippostrongylus brasiliensis TaxID=27835 RepID=A0A0N4XE11_NIPBR|nr:unnamed protein product [Nippostrongylus brasiliensis]
MKALLLVLTYTFTCCVGDVIRTVYCKNQCTDYLNISENSMPLCAAEHLKMYECGTVITCDWAEAERDKVRPVANSSDILCCYRTLIKEKGDCAEPVNTNSDPVQEQVASHPSVSNQSVFQLLPWAICVLLLIVVALQAGYIAKLSMSRPTNQKVSQADDVVHPQVVISQPLVNTRLLGTTSD